MSKQDKCPQCGATAAELPSGFSHAPNSPECLRRQNAALRERAEVAEAATAAILSAYDEWAEDIGGEPFPDKLIAMLRDGKTAIDRCGQATLDELARLRADNITMRTALNRIAEWPYDIMGDCVAEAKREAAEAAKKGSGT